MKPTWHQRAAEAPPPLRRIGGVERPRERGFREAVGLAVHWYEDLPRPGAATRALGLKGRGGELFAVAEEIVARPLPTHWKIREALIIGIAIGQQMESARLEGEPSVHDWYELVRPGARRS